MDGRTWATQDAREYPHVGRAYSVRDIIARMTREHVELMARDSANADTRAMAARRLATMIAPKGA